MKILRVIASMDPATGGPCQGIRNSIPELKKLFVENEVVCLDNPDAAFLKNDDFPVHAIGPAQTPWYYSPRLLPWLLENLAGFDAVIVHGLWLYHGYAVRKAMDRLKSQHFSDRQRKTQLPKVFIMPHGMLDPYFQRAPERRLKALRNWIYWKLIEGKVIREAEGVLFTCKEEQRLASQAFHPYLPKQELNIGYGIAEPPLFAQRMRNAFLKDCPELRNCRYILFLSRIHEKKGVELLIKAYAKVAGRKPEMETALLDPQTEETELSAFSVSAGFPKLVIAGPGLETPYGKIIQQMVSETPGLKGAVFFPGMLSGDAKWGAFYGCEAFILPSHQENFGISIVEAMACGKMVLISDQVNIWQEIQSAGAGMVASDTFGGAQELLENWNRLSVEEKLAMGQQARNSFENNFSVGPVASRLREAVNNYLSAMSR